jgi:hypothetical protein
MSGYVVDDLALIAALAGGGAEHHRHAFSRLLRSAIDGGPRLEIPAMCLAAAAAVRGALADELADILALAPGAITIPGLARSAALDVLRVDGPWLGWPGVHAAVQAIAGQIPVLTVDRERYAGVPVDVLTL